MTTSAREMVAQANATIDVLTPQEAQEELAGANAVLLDVREPVEWEHFIEGAVQVPRGLLEFVADPASPKHRPELDPARRVIVYCNSGSRAALAAATLKSLGFGNVANMKGGFTGWKDAGLPTTEHHAGI